MPEPPKVGLNPNDALDALAKAGLSGTLRDAVTIIIGAVLILASGSLETLQGRLLLVVGSILLLVGSMSLLFRVVRSHSDSVER